MKKKGLRVNMGKTKIIVSGMDLDLLKKSGKDPCSVCQKGVGSNAIFNSLEYVVMLMTLILVINA